MPAPLDILQKTFGYPSFREHQEAIVKHVLDKQDTFVLMPTGGGKSLCYQLPALMMEGLTIVISPLIALMKDQVDALRLNGIAAAYLNSSLSYSEQNNITKQIKAGKLKLVYLAPERLMKTENEFFAFLKNLNISLIAIDEAHCISHWGHDFRPEYRMLAQLKKEFPLVPVMALTATADRITRKDILEKLALKNPVTFISSFNRPNIRYTVEAKRNNLERLIDFLEKKRNDAGIIYCLARVSTESLATQLQMRGFKALAYHAGLEKEIRTRHQDWFLKDEIKIIVATIAFGMGIDKSNVRFVVHMDLPKSIESYYQETGRAGRDGLESEALLYYGYGDVAKLKGFATVESNPEQTRINLQKLDKMASYGELLTCRRKFLLNYFDEEASDYCGHCDICLTQSERVDSTIIAQKVLSAVYRLKERFGTLYVVDFLRGSQSEKIRPEHKALKTYGAGADLSKEDWIRYIHELMALGYLGKSDGPYPVLQLTAKSFDVLNGTLPVLLTKSKQIIEIAAPAQLPHETELFSQLKVLRKIIAESENVAAYIVLSDATLLELATYLPQSKEEFSRISGFGEVKLEKYGKPFGRVVAEYCEKKGLPSRIILKRPRRIRKANGEIITDTKLQSFELFKKGISIEEIAQQRKLSPVTVEGHLAHYVEFGEIEVTRLVPSEKIKIIEEAILQYGIEKLAPLKEALGEGYSFGEIRAVIAHLNLRSGSEFAEF
jgi:ATP-dependent DNA helicase RecQ